MPSEITDFLSSITLPDSLSVPAEVYELIAQAARYWFLLLMAIIVWRSFRWYRRDRRQTKKRLKLLPDAGFVGEMVVIEGGEALKRGQALPVPREGTLGTLRTNDLCVPVEGVARRHLWFRFDEDEGLRVEPMRGQTASVDGEPFKSRREPLYMAHGSRLYVGKAQLRLRLFAGFEGTGYAPRRDSEVAAADGRSEPPEQAQAAAMAQQQAMQQWMAQQQYMMQQQLWQQQAYQQWLMQQAALQNAAGQNGQAEEGADGEEAEAPVRDDSIFMRPAGERAPAMPEETEAAEPSGMSETTTPPDEAQGADLPDGPRMEDGDWPYAPSPHSDADWDDLAYFGDEMDEDLTDAAAPPRSAYVGYDEAERAKRKVWDKYFGGGRGR